MNAGSNRLRIQKLDNLNSRGFSFGSRNGSILSNAAFLSLLIFVTGNSQAASGLVVGPDVQAFFIANSSRCHITVTNVH